MAGEFGELGCIDHDCPAPSVETHDPGRAGEGAEHHDDAPILVQVGDGLDAASGLVEIGHLARAQYDEFVATYRKTALTAYQEVEDSLVSVRRLAEEQAADAAAAKSAQSAAYHADERYAAGVADYIEVTTTHTAALSAESAALAAQAARLNAAVALVQALGGGWTNDRMNQPSL